MSIASEIQRIKNGKDDIKQYVYDEFGVVIPNSVTIDKYKYYMENSDYLSFYCDEAGTIGWQCSISIGQKTIQYSNDFGATWTDITSTISGATVTVAAGDIVWFKGNNTEYAGRSGKYNYANIFTLSSKAHVYGNVNSLTGNNTSVSENCFQSLFSSCSNLYTYENKKIILPATTLASNCYAYMFYSCTSITSAPELPAMTLANGCYQYMFSGCTSLTVVPELPATTLAVSCYNGMFYGCTSLTSAPELPAITLANNCYDSMFDGCTSLTSAPVLSATTLAERCYINMFYGCTSLTSAPELPATMLVGQCYQSMFQGCSSLNYIKAFFTTTPSSSYTSNWVSGVAPTGTFVKSAAATWDVIGNNGIPTGWTIKIDDNRGDMYIEIDIGSYGYFGEPIEITVTMPDDATGNVTLNVEDYYQGTTVPKEGKAEFSIDTYNSSTGEYLLAGTHTAVLTYEGDSNYKPKVETTSFEISKIQSNVTTNITLDGDIAIIDVYILPNDAGNYCQSIVETEGYAWQTGGVLLSSNGTPLSFTNITNGRSQYLLDISSFDRTSPIPVRAIFLGDDKYFPSVSAPAYINF